MWNHSIKGAQSITQQVNQLVGNAAVLKKLNRVRIVNQLRRFGPASRAELARATGLDPKTITNCCNSLLEDRLLHTKEPVVSGRGRPAERMTIDADAALSIGVDIGAQQVTVVALDLQGTVRHQCRRLFGRARRKEALLEAVDLQLDEVLKALPDGLNEKLVGSGVCAPGFLDRKAGVVVQSVNIPGFSDVPIGKLLSDRLGLEAMLEESSRAMALAEVWNGYGAERQSLIALDLGYGIGMGIVHNGQLSRGAHERSGEIGHTVVVHDDGTRCRCGRKGCLETVASGLVLGRRAVELKLPGARSKGAAALVEAAERGHEQAAEALRYAGHCIGIALANVINLFDPPMVVLNGGLVQAGSLLVDPLREAVAEHRVGGAGGDCPILTSKVGPSASAVGAAMLPLRTFYEFENIRF